MRFIKSLIGVMALVAVSCSGGDKSATSPRKVKYESVLSASESVERVSLPGKVEAAVDVNLGFRVAGIIDKIAVDNGTYLRKGDVVATLDSRDYALQAEATLAEYDAVKAEVDRVVALYADESVSANDYDKAVNGLRAITAKAEAAKNALADTKLRAPFNGYLQKSNFDKGEAVAAGTPIVTMISASSPEITVDIPAATYLKHNSFVSATAKVELYPDKVFNLSLKGISPKANLNQLYKATFVVEEVDGVEPLLGMSAMVEMVYSSSNDSAVMIPFSAVVEREGVSSVWVINDSHVQSRPVKVREIKSRGMAIIESGVTKGERVVVAGVNSLKEGQEVSLLEESSPSNIGGIK